MNEQQIFRIVEQAIQDHRMFQANNAVLVGVSGGPDSMALLHILARLAPRWGLTLGVAHLNHGLRKGDAEQDAQFVADHCRRLKLPCYVQRSDVAAMQKQQKISMEMAGRRARYDFFRQVAQAENFDRIALGHHADDNAELILMNLMRGSGPLGMGGIPPVRGRLLVRPLIRLRRDEIIYFVTQNRIEYRRDSSNTDTRFLRNRIRHQLLPQLASSYNPKITDALNRFARVARDEEDWFDRQVESLFADVAQTAPDGVALSIAGLSKIHVALQRRVLRHAVHHIKGDLKKIALHHIDVLHHMIQTGSPDAHADLPGGLAARREDRRLVIRRHTAPRRRANTPATPATPLFQHLIHAATPQPQCLKIPEAGAQILWQAVPGDAGDSATISGQKIVYFDIDTIQWPLTVRSFLPGDRFHPLGMTGSQKLKKFFIDRKIPRHRRPLIPIVLNQGQIIWIAGLRMAEPVKITAKTQNLLKMELLLA